MQTDSKGDLRVWWIPQIPGKAFRIPVATVEEAKKIMAVLANYDAFQFQQRVKPDYCNAGGLECFSQTDDNEWCEWYDEESGCCIDEMESIK